MQSLPSSLERTHINDESLLEINAQSYESGPISKLPPENLLRIFELLVEECYGDTEIWYHITHVCRFWRHLAINTSTLWTKVPTYSDEHNPNWTLVVLERTKSKPIDINLVFTDWKMNLAALQHISHIRELYVELNAEDLNGVAYILSFVGDDAAMLECLCIWASEHDDTQFKVSPSCFSGTSKLEYLDLRWVDVDWSTPLLRQNLTYLSLQDLSLGSAPSWDELLTALEGMPSLSDLTLQQTLPLRRARSTMPIIDLPNLQRLSITCNKASQARSFLSRVSFPPLQIMDIGCDENDRNKNSYSDTLQAIAQWSPISWVSDSTAICRFLTIMLDCGKVIHNHGSLFVCRPEGHNYLSGSQGLVKIRLAPSSEVTTETIVADVLTCLQLSASLTSVYFSDGDGYLSSEAFRELFGSMTRLEEIHATGNVAYSSISALQIPVSHPFGVNPCFAGLQSLFLHEINLKHGSKAYNELEDLLMQRYEYGVEIKRLGLSECTKLHSKTVKHFSEIVLEVDWDGVEEEVYTEDRWCSEQDGPDITEEGGVEDEDGYDDDDGEEYFTHDVV